MTNGLNWKAIYEKHCPQCGAPLVKVREGWECTNSSSLLPRNFQNLSCRFFITAEKLEQLTKNMKNARRKRRA